MAWPRDDLKARDAFQGLSPSRRPCLTAALGRAFARQSPPCLLSPPSGGAQLSAGARAYRTDPLLPWQPMVEATLQ